MDGKNDDPFVSRLRGPSNKSKFDELAELDNPPGLFDHRCAQIKNREAMGFIFLKIRREESWCGLARTYASAYGDNTQWDAAQISGAMCVG